MLWIRRFTEKPDVATAKKLIEEGAWWNGGVFAFGLGYLMDIVHNVRPSAEFNSLRG